MEQWPTPIRSRAQRARSTILARPAGQQSHGPGGTYFADWVAPAANRAFDADFGEVRVETTLDWDLQRLAVRAIERAAIGDAQAALVAMRPDGEVVAMVGGKSYGESPINRATQAQRQPGSAFKLFVSPRSRRLDARQHHRGRAGHHRRLDPGQQ